ncbi:MAG: 2Fe-2S iron-sulfur cluster binding domain-containing protein [Bacteroidia bacterium]|nr:2Fe-2S iron-sulfur cluster binding domain-containing protein [Bacteroidia bacterium]
MQFNPLSIKSITKETPQAVSISFEVPETLKSEYRFEAGQYITLKLKLKGEELRRDYSLCTNPENGELKVVVKVVENGRFSSYANTELREGDIIEVGQPLGRFTLMPKPNTERTIMAIAAGSGITPIMSILISVLENEPKSRFVLLYGNKSPEDTIFKQALDQVNVKYPDRFNLISIYSQTHVKDELFGRIDRSIIRYALNKIGGHKEVDQYFVCGPKPMIDTAIESLTEIGIDKSAIKFELFTTAEIEEKSEQNHDDKNSDVTVIVDDETFSFNMPGDKTILEVALEHDIDAPYSCQGGICSSCLARIKEGQVKMRVNNILTDSEIEDGFILTCQAEPRSSKIVVDYDDV